MYSMHKQWHLSISGSWIVVVAIICCKSADVKYLTARPATTVVGVAVAPAQCCRDNKYKWRRPLSTITLWRVDDVSSKIYAHAWCVALFKHFYSSRIRLAETYLELLSSHYKTSSLIQSIILIDNIGITCRIARLKICEKLISSLITLAKRLRWRCMCCIVAWGMRISKARMLCVETS